jgi:dTMP kinase
MSIFITFEGGEGSGKSTQSKMLLEYLNKDNLNEQNKTAILTREPGGSPEAEKIRELLVTGKQDRWDKISETLLFYAARRNHVENLIKPALAQNKIVICDRFNDSTIAYQGYGHGCSLDVIKNLENIAVANFKPNITFIIDITPEEGLRRAEARLFNSNSNENRFEKLGLQFHKDIRRGFHQIAEDEPDRCRIIDGHNSPENIHEQIIKILQKL